MFGSLRNLLPLGLLCGMCAVVGCGSSNGVNVSGTVSYQDGTPIERGRIVFDPVATNSSPRAAGMIIDGKFALGRKRGPWPGEYIVRIYGETSIEGLDDPRQFAERGAQMLQANPVSSAFNEQSDLTAIVSVENREFGFTVERTRPRQ